MWGIDGDFEFNAIPKKTPFITTDHSGAIRIFTDNILPQYLMIQLENVKHNYGFDRGLRASLKNMAKIHIHIPFNVNDEIDIEKQKEIIEKYNAVEEIKKQVAEYRQQISELSVSVKDEKYSYEDINITELFDIKQGNAYYTKKRVIGNGWKGEIPVYSSNTKNEGLLMKMDLDKIKPNDLYYQSSLTWSVDGYAGKLFIRNRENLNNNKLDRYYFTINNHCGILLPKQQNILLEYILHTLQPVFFEKTKGYGNKKLGTNQIIDINIPIPVNKNKVYDISAQKEIAEKYKRIAEIKDTVKKELVKIEETKIDFE